MNNSVFTASLAAVIVKYGTTADSELSIVSIVRTYITTYHFGVPFHNPGKNGGLQKASFSWQMLRTSVVLNRCEGVGARFLPVATLSWCLQVVQVP